MGTWIRNALLIQGLGVRVARIAADRPTCGAADFPGCGRQRLPPGPWCRPDDSAMASRGADDLDRAGSRAIPAPTVAAARYAVVEPGGEESDDSGAAGVDRDVLNRGPALGPGAGLERRGLFSVRDAPVLLDPEEHVAVVAWELLLILVLCLVVIALSGVQSKKEFAVFTGGGLVAGGISYLALCGVLRLYAEMVMDNDRGAWLAYVFGSPLVMVSIVLTIIMLIGLLGRNTSPTAPANGGPVMGRRF